MKNLKWLPIFILMFLFISNVSFCEDFSAKQPILLTSAGQSADVLMVKILAQKAELQFTFDKLATPDKLKDHNALILVSDGSTKGWSAAKIDKQQELDRIQQLIAAAKKANINIITMHMGGQARRGKLSDEFNQLAAQSADCLIVVKSGDDDLFFSKIAGEKKVPIYLIEKIMDAGPTLSEIFNEPTTEKQSK